MKDNNALESELERIGFELCKSDKEVQEWHQSFLQKTKLYKNAMMSTALYQNVGDEDSCAFVAIESVGTIAIADLSDIGTLRDVEYMIFHRKDQWIDKIWEFTLPVAWMGIAAVLAFYEDIKKNEKIIALILFFGLIFIGVSSGGRTTIIRNLFDIIKSPHESMCVIRYFSRFVDLSNVKFADDADFVRTTINSFANCMASWSLLNK